MGTERLPKAKWTLNEKSYQMPAAVEAELMALGAKHLNSGDARLSEEENFVETDRAKLKKAFIEAVETYWTEDEFKKGPTEASVRQNIQEIRSVIDKLIKRLEDLDLKTADGLIKHGGAGVAFGVCRGLSLMDHVRLAHESLWKTRLAARKYLREEPMDRDEARQVFWRSALEWKHGRSRPRVAAFLILWDGIARALGEQQTLGIRADKMTGSLVGFLDLFMREARIKHVQPRTVAEDFLLARKMWMDEYRNGPS